MYRIATLFRFGLLLPVVLHSVSGEESKSYPKLSPFAAVRWENDRPQVRVKNTWYGLLSLDDVDISKIVEFCDSEYGTKNHMRFEEDLVEVLTCMGKKPPRTSTLTVKDLSTNASLVIENVEWTSANRGAIRNSRLQREEDERRVASGDPQISFSDDRFVESADEFMTAAREATGFNGAVIIAQGDEVLYSKALGHSDLESNVPNTLDTPFRIASLSKQFTAAAILRLHQEGRLQVSDPVAKYLPQFKTPPYDKIQIHHLLSHTSGLPRAPGGFASLIWRALSKRAATTSEYVDLATKIPLSSPPGAQYEYSNFGYRVLSAVIESITERSFADHMDEAVFRPSGMLHSGVARFPTPDAETRVAEGLVLWKLASDSTPHIYRDGQRGRVYASGFGSGGIYASANDLLRWHQVLNSNKLLNENTKELLFRPNLDSYAYGWKVETFGFDDMLCQSHSGSNEGYFSQMMRVPEEDLVVIAVGNQDKTDELDDVIDEFFRLARGLRYKMP